MGIEADRKMLRNGAFLPAKKMRIIDDPISAAVGCCAIAIVNRFIENAYIRRIRALWATVARSGGRGSSGRNLEIAKAIYKEDDEMVTDAV